MKSQTTSDIYKAAYFIMYGARLENVTTRPVAENKARKVGIKQLYILTLTHIPNFVIDSWNTHQAYGNITEYIETRSRLKKRLYELTHT